MRQRFFIWFTICVGLSATALAQGTFSSGSTGADGAFAPTQSMTIQVPDSGVFNYTTVTIPTGVTITYTRNAKNTPLTILASGDVQIAGSITVNGQAGNPTSASGTGGPAGFGGGEGGVVSASGNIADGPGGGGGGVHDPGACGAGGGGGYETSGANSDLDDHLRFGGQGGSTYGSKSLIPLIGGSGGGGGCANNTNGGGGGGGGGAILIASSTKIVFPSPASQSPGVIMAKGGDGGTNVSGGSGGGGGSGGAIRLVANVISGLGSLVAAGGGGGCGQRCAGNGGLGFVRMEGFDLTGYVSSNSSPITSVLPSSVTPANAPTLVIASVAGVAAPANPVGSFQGSPDIVLPANQANPVAVIVNGANIPVGTSVSVTVTSAAGAKTTASATLSGTSTSSSGTANISLSAGLSVLTATTVIDLATTGNLQPMFINGEKVDKIEVSAQYGGSSTVTYITYSGRRIRAAR